MTQPTFSLFFPLSNWVLAYDRYAQAYDKSKLPHTHYPNDTYVVGEHDGPEVRHHVLAKTQALIDRLGVPGDRIIEVRSRLPVLGAEEPLHSTRLAARPNDKTGTGLGWRWPSARLPIDAVGWVDEQGAWQQTRHEHISAQAFGLGDRRLTEWKACKPRSFSVLPIAQACNAQCRFCFSKSSISDLPRERHLPLDIVDFWARQAAGRGANRAVITGGGEPTLLRHEIMTDLIGTLRNHLPYALLISNGAIIDTWRKQSLDKARQLVGQWKNAGLSRVAISRHGNTPTQDKTIMGIGVEVEAVIQVVRECGIPVRGICVLQKGGVETTADVATHLERAARQGIDEVCFKELYVASLSENPLAGAKENQYCEAHQVPLAVVLRAMEELGFTQTGQLPWGSPYFEGRMAGATLRVAAYTEPSVGWERSHALVRSWNLMSDGSCMASLEDPASGLTKEAICA